MTETTPDLGTEYNDLTGKQRSLVVLAAEHADDFATRAAEHDRDASFPFENFKKLHESGYARICLPPEFNGLDARIDDFCIAQERLAQGCASTTLSMNMHGFGTGVWAEFYRQGGEMAEAAKMPLQVCQSGITLGGSLSERDSTNPFTYPSGKVEKVDGGYRLNGTKVFGSNTPINPTVWFNGTVQGDNGPENLMFVLPKETPGVKVIEDWDTLGMRGTGSYTIQFEDVFAPDAVMQPMGPVGTPISESPFAQKFVIWFSVSIGSVYTGIAVAARDTAKALVRDRSRLPFGPLKHTPAVQFAIAEQYIAVESMRAFTRHSARRLSDESWRDNDALALAIATKEFATENARRSVDMSLQMVGGGAFFKKLPLERFYRDVRAGGFHPPSRYDLLELIGKAELGIPETQTPRFV